MYFNKIETNWRISQCCLFNDTGLAKLYNPGTVTKTYALKPDGKQKVQAKAIANVTKLRDVLKNYFSKQPINLRSFRISSELLPCYTLEETSSWYEEILPTLSCILQEAGEYAKKYEIRLSTHPAQFTVLGSDKAVVVKNSIKDLEYHAMIGKLMQIEPEDFVINIHLSGLYGGTRAAGIKRFATNFQYLDDYAQRALAVENEDRHKSGYDIEHTLNLAQYIPIRCTLDIHHYECYRKKLNFITHNDRYFKDAVKTWKNTRPLFHVSHTKIDELGTDIKRINQHSDVLHDLERLAITTPMLEYADFDVEAKHKEVAVKHFYNYILEEEIYAGEKLNPN